MLLRALIVSVLLVASAAAIAATGQFFGSGTNDNDILFTADTFEFDSCSLMSGVGAVDVEVSLNGSTFSTAAPLSLQDYGATDLAPVLVTSPLRLYQFQVKAMKVRVRQNGATATTATMNCWSIGYR